MNGFTMEGQRALGGSRITNANYRMVTADYLRTLAIPVHQGRALDARDTAGAPPVAFINEAMRRKFWPDEDPLGKRLRFGSEEPWITIVGAGKHPAGGPRYAAQARVVPAAVQRPEFATWLAVRTQDDPANSAAAIRQAIRATDPEIPIVNVNTMDEILDRETSQRRVQMILPTAFAALALLLASLGIYGVLAYLVSRRTQEIGIRMALGAAPGDVLRAVVGEGVSLGAAGIAAGIITALGVTRVLSKALFGVTATDPATFAAVAVLLLAMASAASYIPARRATKIDPILALREE